MPTYEYRCPDGHEFEKFYRKISDAGAEVPCPQCGKIGQRKISAGAGLVFKGSGFYITDYGKDGKKDQPSAARSKPRTDGGADTGTSAGGDSAVSSGDTKSAAPDTKAATPETKPASKESTKTDSTSAKPGKSSKPSTE
jgi:putative FmdB family regulatory protein